MVLFICTYFVPEPLHLPVIVVIYSNINTINTMRGQFGTDRNNVDLPKIMKK